MARRNQFGYRRSNRGALKSGRRFLQDQGRGWPTLTNVVTYRSTAVAQSADTDKRGSELHFGLGLGPLPTPRGSSSPGVRAWQLRLYAGTLGGSSVTGSAAITGWWWQARAR